MVMFEKGIPIIQLLLVPLVVSAVRDVMNETESNPISAGRKHNKCIQKQKQTYNIRVALQSHSLN